ncbi:hypothetical protein OG792_02350 [Micromonospora sp. NBC_01699]|uniref:hypothetical protein n=1 Tax=Micromonospora sp. NBC_01699 TaxID=2975984 RepID=UPI002E2BB2FD|nr:hypothetical protein [Micromonospora sp. NBC_01699]
MLWGVEAAPAYPSGPAWAGFYVGANSTSFYRTGLGSRQTICFKVRAHNTAGYSAWNNISCATTY